MKEESRFLAICGWALVGLALFCCCSVEAQFTCITNDNNELTITGYTGPGGDVSIPDSIDGLPVTAIATKACWFNTNIVNLTITNSGITLGEMAFYRCSVLATVAIGPGVTNIGNAAFAYNYTLLSIAVDSSNPNYGSTGGVLFDTPQTTLLQCPGGLTGDYSAGNGNDCGVERVSVLRRDHERDVAGGRDEYPGRRVQQLRDDEYRAGNTCGDNWSGRVPPEWLAQHQLAGVSDEHWTDAIYLLQ
jgi:hypothetical protein